LQTYLFGELPVHRSDDSSMIRRNPRQWNQLSERHAISAFDLVKDALSHFSAWYRQNSDEYQFGDRCMT